MRTINPLQGDVWNVDLEPTQGSEIQKIRPCVVVSPNRVSRFDVRVVVPLTEWQEAFVGTLWLPKIVATPENGLAKDSAADAFQVRTVSVLRFGRWRGVVTPTDFEAIVDGAIIAVGG